MIIDCLVLVFSYKTRKTVKIGQQSHNIDPGLKMTSFSVDVAAKSTGGRHVCRFTDLVNIRWKMQSLYTRSLQAGWVTVIHPRNESGSVAEERDLRKHTKKNGTLYYVVTALFIVELYGIRNNHKVIFSHLMPSYENWIEKLWIFSE